MTSNSRGFTLVEVVVSIAILSMIVLATVTAMRTLALTQETLQRKSDGTSSMVAVTRFLRGSLGSNQAIMKSRHGLPAGQYFIGDENEVEWLAPVPFPGASGGGWQLKLSKLDTDLMLRYRKDKSNQHWTEEDASYILVKDVEEFNVAFRANAYSEWLEAWGEGLSAGMPSHVKFQLKVAGRYWPELILEVGRL
ncbi:prepilin-type N-terminal cleavage/methylation domain-containing protein [Gilvimarinus sp. 1_MG-2023]|uniref:prepilin-type N-terminal cleavage/methylation domain-containing protein n=1 Tax=Gilvimarinus sp. 1_MG-2023 TaxID=3062638 RepID=UPI0026E2F5FA|nr:prepilin-type N-terminal cleavage/methylation domain-containing protein [Gilvimarinus sp. 1_MG-2023]MDO6746792.1 prepilin-type N-terminal cleavage/methylation domain-containing protein [Gilvimarinus sp. 1_MG-2023]